MASCAVESSFDVANWFIERALNDGEYLQPRKLHPLMFLAQAYYAVAYNNRPLMPSVFVTDGDGPIEVNVFRAYAVKKPELEKIAMPSDAAHFLDSIWRRFGQHSTDYLSKMIAGHPPVREAASQGPRTIISMQAMVSFYGKKATVASTAMGAPPVTEVMRPKVLKSQEGKPVSVQKWMPGRKS
ncbi:MAG TPA: hypothetical protein VGG27_00155 [Magnetospirillaceae bacterium]|jgi:uncharacterized phage-associated protein